ncbi:hypothetical protein [Nitratireductor soli]|uniref:hypothetical protein n=1 Tax=Nitratireductor soli TaxID=1670619 RepID=UPI00065E45DB|nr:hypothetical protein [Nitratireductor soli]
MNRHNERDVHDALFHACVLAVAEGFPHLAVRDIIEPPHDLFDAALARQVAIHLMVARFGLPKRRVVEMQQRSREAINRALATVDCRLETAAFETHYRMIAKRAGELVDARMEDAA